MLLEAYQPAIFCAGIKEKYAVQKNGIPCLQLHSYDYGGPFAAFGGACIFYQTVDRMVNTPAWSISSHRGKVDMTPTLDATYVHD